MDRAKQENPDTLCPVGGRLLFVDNTRFWCMFVVVALHCTRVFTLGSGPEVNAGMHAEYLAATLFKFGTIGFFLVSGYLLERDLAVRNPWEILRKRFTKVFAPWFLWFRISVVLFALNDLALHRRPFQPGFFPVSAVFAEAARLLTETALWFVPNLMLCLVVLLLLRRFVHRLEFGVFLLAVNLFYVVNLYTQWIAVLHAQALFGFVFYLWLGHFAAIHCKRFLVVLAALRPGWLYAAILAAGSLAYAESRLLFSRGAIDPLNTLRLSNQVFSILVVLCLCRVKIPLWPHFIDPSRQIFGIYLTHSILVASVLTGFRRLLQTHALEGCATSPLPRTALWVVATALAFGGGLLLTRALAASRTTAWTLGLEPPAIESIRVPHASRSAAAALATIAATEPAT
jgi:surface polysaccharide O-acyltransferase-like enzyme